VLKFKRKFRRLKVNKNSRKIWQWSGRLFLSFSDSFTKSERLFETHFAGYLTILSVATIDRWKMWVWWNTEGLGRGVGAKAEVLGVKNLFHCHSVHIIALLKQNIAQHITRRRIRTKTEECVCYMKNKITDRPKCPKRDKILFRNRTPYFILIVCFLFLPQRVWRLCFVCVMVTTTNVSRCVNCVCDEGTAGLLHAGGHFPEQRQFFCIRRQNIFCYVYMLNLPRPLEG
jgi:hypothetical protein